MQNLFLFIPYGRTLEIGALVYHSGPILPDFLETCHPRRSKCAFFDDFTRFSDIFDGFPGSKRVVLPGLAKTVIL